MTMSIPIDALPAILCIPNLMARGEMTFDKTIKAFSITINIKNSGRKKKTPPFTVVLIKNQMDCISCSFYVWIMKDSSP